MDSHDLQLMGFRRLSTIAELRARPDMLDDPGLHSCGVYALVTPPGYQPAFVDRPEALHCGNVQRPWLAPDLAKKWVLSSDIVYIGLAGIRSARPLGQRLKDLRAHSTGRAKNHAGGEMVWQLRYCNDLSVWYLGTAGPPVPRQTERKLLEEFRLETGALPFGNRR